LQNGIIPDDSLDKRDEVYNRRVWSQKVGTVSNVFQNQHGEYVFFHMIRENPERLVDVWDVSWEIKEIIVQQKINEYLSALTENLKEQFNVVVHHDRLQPLLTAEEIFDMANLAIQHEAYIEALYFLEQILNEYPETQYANDALFMTAYILLDTFNDPKRAIVNFQELQAKLIGCDLEETVNFILNALENNTFDARKIMQH
jgi:hypothetical protein